MIIVIGHLQVVPAERDAFVAAASEAVRQGRAAPGCLDYSLSGDLLDPGRVNVAEQWRTREELDAFRGSGPDDGQMSVIESFHVAEHEVTDPA